MTRVLWLVTIISCCAVRVDARPPTPAIPYGEGAPPAELSYLEPASEEGGITGVGPGLQAAADHVVSLQCPNGGWNWPHGGCASTFNNITAPICLGLLNAYATTLDPDHLAAAVAGGDFDLTSEYPGTCDPDKPRFGTFAPYFLWKLSAASGDSTYSDWAEMEFYDELLAGTYGCNSDWDTADFIAAVQAARTGTWVNLRPWEFHTLGVTAGAIGDPAQKTLFNQAVLDGLDTLDNTAPATVYSDLIGLAGGVRGLALNGTTSFPAIDSPNHAGIDDIDDLCDLAAQLISYQNGDGSWYWHSALPSPGEDDKDTQTTAYAVLALLAAEAEGCGPYTSEIADAREWLRTMQLPDGGFRSYPGGTENIEIEGEASDALIPDPCTLDILRLQRVGGGFDPICVQPNETVPIELVQLSLVSPVRGYQAFVQFDSGLMTHQSSTFTNTPYGLQILNSVSGDNISLAAGIDDNNGQSPTQADALLVTLQFTAGATEGPTTVSFRYNDPPSRFSDVNGGPVVPCLIPSPTILIDGTAPVIDCPADVLSVECGESTDPPSTGSATATDNLDDDPTISYDDDRSGLTGCNATGTIVRTWTATDCAGNSATCNQNITVVDTEDPVLTACPEDIEVNADAGVCTAVVTYTPPTATDECYFEGFEDAMFDSGPPWVGGAGAPSVNWNDYNSALSRVASGTNGIPSKSGGFHGVIDSTVLPAAPDDFTGAFNRLRGYSPVFGTGFRTTLDVYIDLSDPAVAAKTYGWDLSTAASNQANGHRRDFIFHAAADDNTNPGMVLIGASNNSGFTKRNDLETINHYVIAVTGWYTFEWDFHDKGDGTLEVDLNLRDASNTLLWTETRNDPSDVIATVVGGNRYMWFTFLTVDELAIDNTALIRNVPVVCDWPSGSTFPGGTTTVTCTAEDDCTNESECDFDVTVSGFNELVVDVQLNPVLVGTFNRCITFELHDCPGGPVTVEQVIEFTAGLAEDVTVLVPCGEYDCITARDRLHSLRRTDEAFGMVGTQYVADFTADPDTGGDWLIAGNLNGDEYIDILDFGVFSANFGDAFPVDTDCNTLPPHADITGDGTVTTAEFTFIQLNFLKTDEADCCTLGPGPGGSGDGPVTSITVQELIRRGLGDLAVGDLNEDGVLDEADMAAFMDGKRPRSNTARIAR